MAITMRWNQLLENTIYLFTYLALYVHCTPLTDSDDLVAIRRKIENQLKLNLKFDRGTGCVLPIVDPFSSDAIRFGEKRPNVKCNGTLDWVKCYRAQCRVADELKKTVKSIKCRYQDIIYYSDTMFSVGPATSLHQEESYELNKSDLIKVTCTGKTVDGKDLKWTGSTLGLRRVEPQKPPPGRENTYNVLIFGLDSMSRNGFIRRMPKSWKVLTEVLGATVMEGYNIVGDATLAAILPILTGHTALELAESRKRFSVSATADAFPFIFHKLRKDGYRTAYFEDTPYLGTFQWRSKGLRHQPTDHYLRAFFMKERKYNTGQCVGSTPQYKFLMDMTKKFMRLDGKRFAFTFIGDISHDDFNMMETADDDMATFLKDFRIHNEDTLLVVMGDHGPRSKYNANQRKTLQGKFEERQPLMALRLPAALVRARPAALAALQRNARALTTPHDLHATLLDVLGMAQHWNPYRVPGADLKRGLTMLEPISRSRSCSEAGIKLHWCACVDWQSVPSSDPLYNQTAEAVIDYMNELGSVDGPRSPCSTRTLQSIEWVHRQQPNRQMLTYLGSSDAYGFTSSFGIQTKITEEKYRLRIVVGPGVNVFEALLTYVVQKKLLLINPEDIVRTETDSKEYDCLDQNIFCYCER